MSEAKTLSEKSVAWVALAVSIISATFTYVQITTTKAQLRLNELQIRPYVKYIPNFFESKQKINIDMVLENLTPVPATVIYTELTPWVDGITSGVNMHSVTQDILYEHKGGGSSLPPITGETAKRLLSANAVLEIGVCIIYTSLSKSDSRHWQMNSVYEYVPRSTIPRTVFVGEENVPASKLTCDSKEIRELLLKARSATYPK